MKAITLWQPYASLIPMGFKHYETRHWATNYRGKILIHSAKRKMRKDDLITYGHTIGFCFSTLPLERQLKPEDLPYGKVVAIANLTDCIEMTQSFINKQTEE